MAKKLVAFKLCFEGYVIDMEQDLKNQHTWTHYGYTFLTTVRPVWISSYLLSPSMAPKKETLGSHLI